MTSRHRRILLACLAAVATAGIAQTARAQRTDDPRVALTELAYKAEVEQVFDVTLAKGQSALNADRDRLGLSSQSEVRRAAGTHLQISQGELRNFGAALRGLILKGGGLRLVQAQAFDPGSPQPTKAEQVLEQLSSGKPAAQPKRQPDVHDIVTRIRKGEFAGADYVLFGSISEVELRNEAQPLQGTTTVSHQFSLDITAEYNLIDTRTLEIKAAFSATGSGSDVKLVSERRDAVAHSKPRVVREAAETLAADAYAQLREQLGLPAPTRRKSAERAHGDVTVLR